jgi:hypothetical protein
MSDTISADGFNVYFSSNTETNNLLVRHNVHKSSGFNLRNKDSFKIGELRVERVADSPNFVVLGCSSCNQGEGLVSVYYEYLATGVRDVKDANGKVTG